MHLGRVEVASLPVSWQEPLEAVREQALHRGHLGGPVEPARIAEGVDLLPRRTPRRVIATEEVAACVEQARRALGVTGRRDDEQVIRQTDLFGTAQL